jgi:hypothetical protein
MAQKKARSRVLQSGEFAGSWTKTMSHPPAVISARRASIFALNFPAIGWAAASSWIHTFLGHHSGHFKMIPGRRLLRYISIDSFLPTFKLFVSSVPVG